MNRQANTYSSSAPGRHLRLGALVLVFVAINQIEDPLVNATLGQDITYWCIRLVTMVAGLWLADAMVARHLPDRWPQPAWLKPIVLVSLLGLLPFSIVEVFMERQLPMRPEFMDDELFAISPALAWLTEYGTIVSIFLPVHLVLWLVIDRPALIASSAAVAATPVVRTEVDLPLPEFLDKTSVNQVKDVLALQADEHYVRVFTSEGSELVHGRFKDAIAAMPVGLGLRVHRSWWVADVAVAWAKRGARRWQLTLATGEAVPVSDSYVGSVRERGWLKKKSASPG